MDLLYIAFIFCLIALLLAVFGPMLGVGGAGMALQIAKIFIVIFVLLLIISLIFGSGFSGGHAFT